MSLRCLILITVPFFLAFRVPEPKDNVNEDSADVVATKSIYQSMDGGKTWQDISRDEEDVLHKLKVRMQKAAR